MKSSSSLSVFSNTHGICVAAFCILLQDVLEGRKYLAQEMSLSSSVSSRVNFFLLRRVEGVSDTLVNAKHIPWII